MHLQSCSAIRLELCLLRGAYFCLLLSEVKISWNTWSAVHLQVCKRGETPFWDSVSAEPSVLFQQRTENSNGRSRDNWQLSEPILSHLTYIHTDTLSSKTASCAHSYTLTHCMHICWFKHKSKQPPNYVLSRCLSTKKIRDWIKWRKAAGQYLLCDGRSLSTVLFCDASYYIMRSYIIQFVILKMSFGLCLSSSNSLDYPK